MMLRKLYLYGLLACLFSFSSYAEDTAKLLFDQSSPMLFQIRVIDKASGNKSTIGSGFQVSATGVIATNYHVISDYVLEREKYSIEVLDRENNTITASLINFDIVHDLALLQVAGLNKQALMLSLDQLSHGNRIYSMGNPNDLGMTIVEGIYNGLVEASRYQKYLFSGSLNPGMSGGPAFNSAGEVIGINVSKGGEQISFLVPVQHLNELMAQGFKPLNPENYNAHTLDYLLKDQDNYYTILLDKDWQTKGFQQFELPDKIHGSLKCWGHTLEKEDNHYEETHRHCKTEDEIYIHSDFYTGSFSFSYESITSNELNMFQFYKLLEQNYVMSQFSNGASKEDTTNFSCATDFIVLGGETEKHNRPWKVTTCIREYVKYKGVYDVGLIAMYADSIGSDHEALMITLKTTGINKQNITGLHNKFLGLVKWSQ